MKKQMILSLISSLLVMFCLAQPAVTPAVTGNGIQGDQSAGFDPGLGAAAHTENDSLFILYPNPATDVLWMRVSSTITRTYRVTFFDTYDRRLGQQEYIVEPGTQQILLNLPNDDSGRNLYVRVEESGRPIPRVMRIQRQW